MKKVSWIFKGGWFLGGLAIIYQIIILLGIGDYPNYSRYRLYYLYPDASILHLCYSWYLSDSYHYCWLYGQ